MNVNERWKDCEIASWRQSGEDNRRLKTWGERGSDEAERVVRVKWKNTCWVKDECRYGDIWNWIMSTVLYNKVVNTETRPWYNLLLDSESACRNNLYLGSVLLCSLQNYALHKKLIPSNTHRVSNLDLHAPTFWNSYKITMKTKNVFGVLIASALALHSIL